MWLSWWTVQLWTNQYMFGPDKDNLVLLKTKSIFLKDPYNPKNKQIQTPVRDIYTSFKP